MSDSLRLDTANLVGLILQAFFYGVFQVLFVACIYVLVCRRKTDRVHWGFLLTACLMWILIGLNFALSWSRIMDAFIALQPALQNDPEAIIKYFWNLGHWKEVTRTACYIGLTAVADILFIFRCYIVWGRSKLIILLPILLLCGSVSCGIGIEVVIGKAGWETNLFATTLAPWVTAFFSFSLFQNALTTCLIVFRIWRVNIGVRSMVDSPSLWPVMAVLLESGAIYSSTLIVLLMAYVSGSFSQYIALDMLVPIIGIVFNLIIVRVGLGLSQNFSSVSPLQFPLQKLSITVSRHVTVERDPEGDCPEHEPRYGRASDTLDDVSDTVERGWKAETTEV